MSALATGLPEHLARAETLHQQGKITEARQLYEEVVGLQPDHCGALNALGVLWAQARDARRACVYFERVIAAQPDNLGAHCNRGLALKQLGQFEAALASFDRAIALNPDDPVVHFNRAETCRDMAMIDEALAGYDRASALDPGFVQSHFRRGILLQQTGRVAEAIVSHELVLALKPDHADALANRAISYFMLGRYDEALAAYEHTLTLNPDIAGIHLFRGNVLKELHRREEALASYDRAIALDAEFPAAYANRAIVLHELGLVDQALASYARAIEIHPNYAEAYFNRAYVLRSIKRFDAAAADYRRAAKLAPNIDYLPGARMEVALQTCDWLEFDALLTEITTGIESGRAVSHPFNILGLSDSPTLQLQAARIWMRQRCPADHSLGPIARRPRSQKLRIGYFSADFRDHPTSRLIAELIETHDRSRFEVLGFAFGPGTDDDARQRLVAAFDRFIDVDGQSNRDVALLSRRLELDIAIDLGGYTHNGRPGIFALRAAPLQVSYLGYLSTLGASYMDYIVADGVVITPESEPLFDEKVVYLPETFQVNDRQRRIADRIFTRAELGLPAAGFVFCCFNTSYKILPATFASWMRILNRVPLSVLFLVSGEPALETNLRAYAARHRIDPRRLIFADRVAPPEYLARYRTADLFLDTLPYNAGATASDALWAGLPVLTLAGDAFAARIAASLLTAVGLPELVTTTRDAYEDLAVALASDPLRLRRIRNKLHESIQSSPLFETGRYTRNLEAAFAAMQARHDAGSPPDHIHV
jgi:predicted O-linked N-acetylglucosamine transferase (SPINDLY family)